MGSISPAFVDVQGEVSIAPYTGGSSPAWVNVAGGAAGAVPANSSRKRVSIGNPPANASPFNVGFTGETGAARGLPVAPGTWVDVDGNMALEVFNTDGGAQDFAYIEYT